MDKTNILVFMTDHQRGDTVLPEHPVVKPHLSRLAREGVTFSETFCPSPHCCPARATFMSGLYPTRHGVWNNICNDQALSRGLKPGVRLWSEDLAAAGYRLEWSGKWHVSVEETPRDRGWHELFVTGHRPREHHTAWEHYGELAEKPYDEERGEGQILRPGYGTYTTYGSRGSEGNPHDEKTVEEALKVLPGLVAQKDPWILYVGASAPHDPYMVPQKFLDMYSLDDVDLPPSYADELADKPRIYQRMRRDRWGQLSERETREAIRHFWAYCTYLDDLFGKLLEVLDGSDQAGNTLVLYTSDHGDYCGDHGLFAKGIPCFRGAYNVPAVVRWPEAIENPGRRVDALVSLADFGPTFLEAAGISPQQEFSGTSLIPFLRDDSPADWRDAVFTQCNGVELFYTQRSVMTREFKYVFNGFDMDELYDLRSDPHEMKNLADDAAYGDIKRRMLRRMWKFAHREGDSAINGYITVALAPYGPAEAFLD